MICTTYKPGRRNQCGIPLVVSCRPLHLGHIGKSRCDVNRAKFKVLNCSKSHDNVKCSRAEGRCKAFIVVQSRTLGISLCNKTSLEVFNGAILIVIYLEYQDEVWPHRISMLFP